VGDGREFKGREKGDKLTVQTRSYHNIPNWEIKVNFLVCSYQVLRIPSTADAFRVSHELSLFHARLF